MDSRAHWLHIIGSVGDIGEEKSSSSSSVYRDLLSNIELQQQQQQEQEKEEEEDRQSEDCCR